MKLTKQAKLASIDEDKADEADQGDWGSWTANKRKADEAGKAGSIQLAAQSRPSTAGPPLGGLSRMTFTPFTPFTPFTNFSDGSRCTKEVPPITLKPNSATKKRSVQKVPAVTKLTKHPGEDVLVLENASSNRASLWQLVWRTPCWRSYSGLFASVGRHPLVALVSHSF